MTRIWRLLASLPLVPLAACATPRRASSPATPIDGERTARVEAARALASRADSLARRFAANRSEHALLAAAMATADSAVFRDPTVVEGYAARGAALSAAGRPRDAAQAYLRALALDPDHSRAANAALGQLWRAGMYDEAYRWGKRQAEREPTNLPVLLDFSIACGFLVEPARAESLLVRALAIDSTFAPAHGALAFLAQHAGRAREAAAHMRRALAVEATSVEHIAGLAQMLVPIGAGEARRAARLLAPIVATRPTASAYGGRSVLAIQGWALRESGDASGAARAFDRALERLHERERAGETTHRLFREMAVVQALAGDRLGAIASLQKAADAGMRTYASWELSDPMLASLRGDPEVERIVERMRADTRRMRARAGLE